MAFAGYRRAARGGVRPAGSTLDLGVADARTSTPASPFLRLRSSSPRSLTAGLAALIGAGALRVRGLLLAVSTFAFAVAASQYLYRQPVLSDDGSRRCRFAARDVFGLDLSSQRTYYYVVPGRARRGMSSSSSRLRRSGIGRTTIAVRDNADRRGRVHGRRRRVEAPRVRARRVASPVSAARCWRARSSRCRSPSATSWSPTRSRSSRMVVIGGIALADGRGARRVVGHRAARVLPRQRRWCRC